MGEEKKATPKLPENTLDLQELLAPVSRAANINTSIHLEEVQIGSWLNDPEKLSEEKCLAMEITNELGLMYMAYTVEKLEDGSWNTEKLFIYALIELIRGGYARQVEAAFTDMAKHAEKEGTIKTEA